MSQKSQGKKYFKPPQRNIGLKCKKTNVASSLTPKKIEEMRFLDCYSLKYSLIHRSICKSNTNE